MKLIVENLALNYLDEGKGAVVLMLHGWASELTTFDNLARELAQSYRVVRLNLPGFGGSEPPADTWGVGEYAQFVKKFLQKLQINDNLYGLIGHSLGGRIAIEAVGAGTLSPKRLVLLGSHGIRESSSLRNRLFWLAAKAGKVVAIILPKRWQGCLRGRLYRTAGSSDYLQAGSMRAIFSKIINQDARAQAAQITVSTLLIYGEHDQETPVRYGKIFNGCIPGSRLKVIKSASHYVHQDQPEQVKELIRAFLQ